MRFDHDVIVVGAGIAGSMVAYRLAKAGANVLILESGSSNPSRPEMVGRYVISPTRSLHSPYADGPTDPADHAAPSPNSLSTSTYYDQPPAPHQQYKSTYERRTGGSTWHWLGHTPRLLKSDFRMRTLYDSPAMPKDMVDWPISYDDLEPWYCQAETEMGIAGDHDDWQDLFGSHRSQPFPMSMIWPSYSDEWIAGKINGAEFEGFKYQVKSTPSARNSTLYDGRPPCAGNSICVPICPIGAKYDGAVHVRKAQAAGAKLQDRSVVTKLLKDADNSVHTVQYKTYDGVEHTATAEVVVVAAHAIETPKLLLMSDVANGSKQVGHYLMDHLSKSSFGMVSEPLFPFRGPPSTSGMETFRDGDFRKDFAGFRISLNNDGWSRLGSPYSNIVDLIENQRVIGADLQEKLFDTVTRQLRLSCSVEVAPDYNNVVSLSKQTDSFGLPRPAINFTVPQYSMDGLTFAHRVFRDMFEKLGATNVLPIDPVAYDGAGHIMGTCRMGNDPASSVVDAMCRTHEHSNLFIAGSSVFPTCGSPNPTLTLAALALRTANEIAIQLGRPEVNA